MKMHKPDILHIPRPRNAFNHVAGLSFLFLLKGRHFFRGYRKPRPFPATNHKKAIEYDLRVVDHWLDFLSYYAGGSLKGKTVLELGPGADLGTGLITLVKGASRYHAIDANNLAGSTPREFYHALLDRLSGNADGEVVDELRRGLDLTVSGRNNRLNYVVSKDFDVYDSFQNEQMDLIFSQAAFEHFDDVNRVISGLSGFAKSGAVLIAEIDLKTHSRWLRDVDPLNIYRFSDFIYGLLKFPGSPNRLRPFEYRELLGRHGWGRIETFALVRLETDYLDGIRGSLAKRFRDPVNEMECLSMVICATRERGNAG